MPPNDSSRSVAPITPGQARIARPLIKWFTRANVWLYRATDGRLGGHFPVGNTPVCLVTMRGRKTGKPRTIALIHVPVPLDNDEGVVLIASQGGMDTHPTWYHNLVANPDIEVQVGATRRPMRATEINDPDPKQTLWSQAAKIYPDFDDYQSRTSRNIPLFLCKPLD